MPHPPFRNRTIPATLIAVTLAACGATACAQDQAPARTSAAPRVPASQATSTSPPASPADVAATQRCIATPDAPDRSRKCEELSSGNPAIIDQNPTSPPK